MHRRPAHRAAAGRQSASATVGGVTLQTSTIAIADLNDAVAARYGIERQEGVLPLVTVRDAAGNGILATRSWPRPPPPLPDPGLKPLDLRAIAPTA